MDGSDRVAVAATAMLPHRGSVETQAERRRARRDLVARDGSAPRERRGCYSGVNDEHVWSVPRALPTRSTE